MKFAVIDVETTGLDPAVDRVVEIAAVTVENDNIVSNYQALVNPGIRIPATASAIHHITDQDVRDCPTFDEVWRVLYNTIIDPSDVLVAHNAPFDRSFLPDTGKRWLDTRRLAQHLYPDAPNYQNQTLRYWLGIDVIADAHHASDDALVTAMLLIHMLRECQKRGIEDVLSYAESPVNVSVMPFGKYKGERLADVPVSYLGWLLTTNIDADLRHSIESLN